MKKLILVLALLITATFAFAGDLWCNFTIDAGVPYTGMIADNIIVMYDIFDATPYTSNFTMDIIGNIEVGFTPFHVTPEISLGGMLRGSYALTISDFGTYDYYLYGYYLGTESYYSTSQWFSVSPMFAMRYKLDENSIFTLGLGAGYYNYTGYTFYREGDFDNASQILNINSVKGKAGFAFCFIAELKISALVIEAGMNGPDFLAGVGFGF